MLVDQAGCLTVADLRPDAPLRSRINYMSMVYTDRVIELGAAPSTGTIGDSYDNALAEAVNGLYKTS